MSESQLAKEKTNIILVRQKNIKIMKFKFTKNYKLNVIAHKLYYISIVYIVYVPILCL